jgi:hypothetical protein
VAEGDHYHEAERLARPARPPQLLPDPDAVALAQVHATLALADQLARVAEALEVLVERQQEVEASPAVADQIERVADVLTTLVHVQQERR